METLQKFTFRELSPNLVMCDQNKYYNFSRLQNICGEFDLAELQKSLVWNDELGNFFEAGHNDIVEPVIYFRCDQVPKGYAGDYLHPDLFESVIKRLPTGVYEQIKGELDAMEMRWVYLDGKHFKLN
jgi:hypothetical protein